MPLEGIGFAITFSFGMVLLLTVSSHFLSLLQKHYITNAHDDKSQNKPGGTDE